MYCCPIESSQPSDLSTGCPLFFQACHMRNCIWCFSGPLPSCPVGSHTQRLHTLIHPSLLLILQYLSAFSRGKSFRQITWILQRCGKETLSYCHLHLYAFHIPTLCFSEAGPEALHLFSQLFYSLEVCILRKCCHVIHLILESFNNVIRNP